MKSFRLDQKKDKILLARFDIDVSELLGESKGMTGKYSLSGFIDVINVLAVIE